MIKSSVVEEWKDEGRLEAQITQGREFVIEVLTMRFTTIPTKLLQSIRSIDDPDRLRMLLRSAVSAESIETFAQRLAAS